MVIIKTVVDRVKELIAPRVQVYQDSNMWNRIIRIISDRADSIDVIHGDWCHASITSIFPGDIINIRMIAMAPNTDICVFVSPDEDMCIVRKVNSLELYVNSDRCIDEEFVKLLFPGTKVSKGSGWSYMLSPVL